jgi:hypothetical protein
VKRRAKILCAFGSIELVVSFLVLFIFEHTSYPWGARGGLGGGIVTEEGVERAMIWQFHVLISTVGSAVVGIAFLLASGTMFLISKLKPGIR